MERNNEHLLQVLDNIRSTGYVSSLGQDDWVSLRDNVLSSYDSYDFSLPAVVKFLFQHMMQQNQQKDEVIQHMMQRHTLGGLLARDENFEIEGKFRTTKESNVDSKREPASASESETFQL